MAAIDLVIESLHQAPVRLLGELASLEASTLLDRLCHAEHICIRSCEVGDWHKGLRYPTKFEQNLAPTQGAHLHQVIFLRMQVDFVRPSDRDHSVT